MGDRRVGADGAAIYRRKSRLLVDTATSGSRVACTGTTNGAAGLDVHSSLIGENAAAVVGGRVGTDCAARYCRDAKLVVVDAAAVVSGRVPLACPADGAAVLDCQRGR